MPVNAEFISLPIITVQSVLCLAHSLSAHCFLQSFLETLNHSLLLPELITLHGEREGETEKQEKDDDT